MPEQTKKAYYLRIYDTLLEEIRAGAYSDGRRLPTEKELAGRFGVSIITSRSALKLLAENGYITRIPKKGSFVTGRGEDAAKPQASGKAAPAVGLLLTDFDENYATDLLRAIAREADDRDLTLILRRSYESQELEEKALAKLTERGADGFIIMPVHGKHYNLQILRLVLDRVPIVIVDRELKGINASFVGSDNAVASKKATDYLLELGHRNIAFVSPPVEDTSTLEDRLHGFVTSHVEHGVNVDLGLSLQTIVSTVPGSRTPGNAAADIEKIKALLLAHPQITCLFAAEYCIALLALQAVEALGRRVPEDCSILCFDGPSSPVGGTYFTHVRQNEQGIGAAAVELLMRQLEDIEDKQILYLDTELVIGKSVKRIQ
jgi:GntR family transcriptional regulator of arabinose operon